MSESDTIFNERDWRCPTVQIMLSTDPTYDNKTIASTLKMQIRTAWKSTSQCTWICWRVWWSPGTIRWLVADPGCDSMTQYRPTSPKRPRLGFRTSATTLYPSLTGPLFPRPEPAGLLRLAIRREHHQHDLPQHQTQPDRHHRPSPHQRLWKRHAPSSGSVSRRSLRLKAAIVNRCLLY